MRSKVLIVNRSSVVSGGLLSRSVQERIAEPLTRSKLFDVRVLNEQEVSSETLNLFDVVVMNRPHSPNSLRIANSCAAKKIRLIVDLDDIPVLFLEGDSAYLDDQKRNFFFESLSLASHISCSTHALLSWAQEHYACIASSIVTTGFDFDSIDHLYAKKISDCDKSIVFTNAGSIKLGVFKDTWLAVMKKALNRYGWKLDVFADFQEPLPEGLPNRYLGSVPWLEHKAILQKSRFPGAVVPLAADEDPAHRNYAQYKTPVKYIIYGGLGIPAIYSNSSIYQSVVQNGETGWLVENTEASWELALEQLITDSSLACRIRQNAKSDVRTKFDIKKTIGDWEQILS